MLSRILLSIFTVLSLIATFYGEALAEVANQESTILYGYVSNAETEAGRPPLAFPEACGNGIVELQEKCDDGNTVNGDGCSYICNLENH